MTVPQDRPSSSSCLVCCESSSIAFLPYSPQRVASSLPPPDRINRREPVMVMIKDMIGHHAPMPIDNDGPVKVVKNEESREEEPTAPEWRRNPCVQVIIIQRRRIVRNYRWTLIVIIIVNDRGFGVLRRCGRLSFRVLTGRNGHDSKPERRLRALQ